MSGTALPLPTEGPTAGGGDEFGDLFDYDIDGENDPFSENYIPPAAKEKAKQAEQTKNDAELGIDQEVEVTRKPRAPRVKLDEDRLLSANGISKLRSKAKHHLKFKGKGHEYSDTARLLSFYQLWLDDLFPKAKFLDALAMVEKMGHKKRMQMMRMEWINEGKPHSKPDEDSLFDEPAIPIGENGREKTAPRIAPIFEKRASERPKTPIEDPFDIDMDDMDDLYDATPRAPRQKPTEEPSADSNFGGGSLFGQDKSGAEEEPPEDELDALLAEEEEILKTTSANAQPVPAAKKVSAPEDDFDLDEMEAMAEMEGMW